MKKYTDAMNMTADRRLEKLLLQRRAPLSQDGMHSVLQDLTLHMTTDVTFAAAVFPKKEALSKIEITTGEIDRADIMLGTDNERYFPVFTTIERLRNWKPALKEGEYFYLMKKEDLLEFLQNNPLTAATVVNPGEDGLLLYRMQLQNLIQVQKENA